jgi:hypothetical protein
MDIPDEKDNKPSTKLSLVYKTDPFGFPVHLADENSYIKDIERKKAESESLDLDIPGSDLDEDGED